MSRSTTNPYPTTNVPFMGWIRTPTTYRDIVLCDISEERFIEMALNARERKRADKALARYRFSHYWDRLIPHEWRRVASVQDFVKESSVDRRFQKMLEVFWMDRDAE